MTGMLTVMTMPSWVSAEESKPAPMPLLLGRRFRKRWRWVGAFADNLIVFAAIVQVGPATMTFWGIWDRERRRLWERTRRDLPGRRRDVAMRGSSVRVRAGSIEFDLDFDEGYPIECMCPNGEGGYSWTRKAAGMQQQQANQGQAGMWVYIPSNQADWSPLPRTVEEALDQLGARLQAFDIVVTDFNMPELSGIELARRIAVRWPALPVVLSSGLVSEALREQARQVGVRAVLKKENSFEDLAATVERVLAGA